VLVSTGSRVLVWLTTRNFGWELFTDCQARQSALVTLEHISVPMFTLHSIAMAAPFIFRRRTGRQACIRLGRLLPNYV
jgi:hypothetical protein